MNVTIEILNDLKENKVIHTFVSPVDKKPNRITNSYEFNSRTFKINSAFRKFRFASNRWFYLSSVIQGYVADLNSTIKIRIKVEFGNNDPND